MELSADLVSIGAAELARRIADGQYSATLVADDYIQRLTDLHHRCNVLTCERFDEARREARIADERRAKGEWLGPLHGVPITVKDCFHVSGLPTTLGIDSRQAIAAEDAVLVSRLRRAGAIILAKTNVSQAMVFLESSNPRYGRTLHPLDPQRSPGGSSGGEAATVAGGGSALGLASDLAGSIRIPAHFCGTCALKPTGAVLDTSGMEQAFPFSLPIPTCPGPIARRVQDLVIALQVLRSDRLANELDAWVTDDLSTIEHRPVRFAVWTEDGYFPTLPAIRQAIEATAHTLSELGMTRVDLPLVDMDQVIALQTGVLLADGGTLLREFVGQGRRDPLLAETLRLAGLSPPMRFIAETLGKATHRHYFADLVRSTGRKSVASFLRLASTIERLRDDFTRTWQARRVDILLTPAFPLPALPHGAARVSVSACGFSFFANLMNLPAGVIPVGAIPAMESRSLSDAWPAPKWAQQAMQGASGLPIGIQVIGAKFQEAQVLRMMRVIEAHAGRIGR
jgi:fatty acid amide hydrolase